MGTNYYVHRRLSKEKISELKQALDRHLYAKIRQELPEPVHIGKHSGGWKFLFNHNNWRYYSTLEDLKRFVKDNQLVDEYGIEISTDEFWNIVEGTKEGMDDQEYIDKWEELHPEAQKPDYVLRGATYDFCKFGYRFAGSVYFS